MSYALSFIETGDYLQVDFSGNFCAGDVKALWREINEYLFAHPQQRILVIEQPGAMGKIKTLEVFKTAEAFALSMRGQGVRVALLYQADVSPKTLYEANFGETVAVNRGLQLKVFQVRAEAEQWLYGSVNY